MDGGEPEEVVVIAAPSDAGTGTAQVTVIDVASLPAAADLAAAVERAPGVVVQRLGAAGDLAQVGIRAAGARHSEILLDGISLNPEGGAAIDLSELPLSAFARIEVYRGAAPASLGTTGMGGAVALVPVMEEVRSVQLGVGAFDTLRGAATAGVRLPGAHLLVNVDALHTSGAYPYYDDRGTALVPADDRIEIRANNDTGQGSALVRVRTTTGPVRFTGLYSGGWREEGVPGSITWPSASVRYAAVRHVAGLRATAGAGASELALRGTAVLRSERLVDVDGEIGAGAEDARDRSRMLGADGQVTTAWTEKLTTLVAAGARFDGFTGEDLLADAVDAHQRTVGRAVASATIGDGVLAPAVLALWTADDRARSELYVLPRLGARVERGPVTVRANAGGFARPPDLVELYGDSGALHGNDALTAEHGHQLDLGASWRRDRAGIDVVAFFAAYRDQIVWTTGAQGVSMPQNLDRSFAGGVEAAADWADGPWIATLRATWTEAIHPTDAGSRRVPRVPEWDGGATIGWRSRWLSLTLDTSAASRTWADSANTDLQPARWFLGSTVAVPLPGALRLDLDTRNWLERRSGLVPADVFNPGQGNARTAIVDFTGYPLPGRVWTCTLRWQPR